MKSLRVFISSPGNPDELLIRIVDNGNEAERGTVRRYTTRYVAE